MLTNTRILISGGGIGGCALAYFLKEKGFNPVVVESAPEFKHLGYLLALNAQIGQKVAEKMGILETLKKFEVPLTRSTLLDRYNSQITSFKLDYETHNNRVGMMMNRADLHETLYNKVKDSTKFYFGDSIASVVDSEREIEVTFESGKKEVFDLVIGVDGVHSKTRKLIFGNGFEKSLGQAYFAFTTKNKLSDPIAQPDEAVAVRADGFTLAYHMLQNNEIGGYVFHNEEAAEKLNPKERRKWMIEKYAESNSTFKKILESMSDEEPIFHDEFIQIVMPTWQKGRTCLLGDAAYCPTPASGVGASLAMAGAYVLTKYLVEEPSYKDAFAKYETYMRPTIDKAHKMAKGMAGLASGKSFISYDFTNMLLKILPMSLLSRLHSHAVDMKLP